MNIQNNISPVTSSVPTEERTWASVCHLSGLVGYLGAPALFHILAPLVIWLIMRNGKPFIDDQGKEAVNFQISLTVYALAASIIGGLIGIILLVSIIGIPVALLLLVIAIPIAVAFTIAGIVLSIVAAYNAGNGEIYRYPFTIRFIA